MKAFAFGLSLCSFLLISSAHAEEATVETPQATQAEKIQQAVENARQKQRAKPSKLRKTLETTADVLIDTGTEVQKLDSNPATRQSIIPRPVIDSQDAVSRPEPQ